MTDLYGAIAISLLLAGVLATFSLLLARHLSKPLATTLVLLVTTALFLNAILFLDDLHLAQLLPFSNAIILANVSPYLVALLVGLAWRIVPGTRLRKAFTLMPLVGICLYKSYAPAFVATPTLGDRWDHAVCRQTSHESCSAAAAATLLYAHGIRASEQEMAALCLTSPQGTPMLGLYRGLKLKTRDTQWDVEVFHGSIPELRGLGGAMLLTVGLKKGQPADPRYEKEWGWPPGVKHTVVLLDFPDPEVDIADPAVGRERWSLQDLQVLWYGEGLRLIKRNP